MWNRFRLITSELHNPVTMMRSGSDKPVMVTTARDLGRCSRSAHGIGNQHANFVNILNVGARKGARKGKGGWRLETTMVTRRSAYANRELLEVNKSVPGRMFSEMAIVTLSKSANSADTEQAQSSQKHTDFTGDIKWFPLISGSNSKQLLLRKRTGVRLFPVSYLSGHRVKL